jgi:phospholipid-binding lipoprotein MlaA
MRMTIVLATFLLAGCSTLDGPEYGVFDTAEGANRISYKVTDAVDRTVLVPVARGYRKVTPDWARTGVTNFFRNLRTPYSALNAYLQGKPVVGTTDLGRFLMNSTVGLGGLFDVATATGLRYQDEDLGQTLAVWGYTRSRFVYVPFFGPSTVRDLPDLVFRGLLPGFVLGENFAYGAAVLDAINARSDALVATDARDAGALDPYAFTREAYYQIRKYDIFDGRPPMDDFDEFFDDEDWEDEDWEDEDEPQTGAEVTTDGDAPAG